MGSKTDLSGLRALGVEGPSTGIYTDVGFRALGFEGVRVWGLHFTGVRVPWTL